MQLFRFQKGYSPVMVTNAHGGTAILPEIATKMTEAGLANHDADLFLSRILDLPSLESAAMMTANLSRYVVDLMCDPSSADVVPVQTSQGQAIYLPDAEPDENEVAKRVEHFYAPFYRQLDAEIDRLANRFGSILLIDAHAPKSKRSPSGSAIKLCLPENVGSGRWSDLRTALERSRGEQRVELDDLTTLGRIATRYQDREEVIAFELSIDQNSYLDPDDGSLDFQLAKELIERLEPIFVSIIKWAEAHAIPKR